jgi:hypothetical protein
VGEQHRTWAIRAGGCDKDLRIVRKVNSDQTNPLVDGCDFFGQLAGIGAKVAVTILAKVKDLHTFFYLGINFLDLTDNFSAEQFSMMYS